MKKYNKYGFISGGWLFDNMDKIALKMINKEHPETKNKQVYTMCANVVYQKQVCDEDDIRWGYNVREKYEWGPDKNGADFRVDMLLTSKSNDEIIYAHAEIYFKIAKRNYCETKGEGNGNNEQV